MNSSVDFLNAEEDSYADPYLLPVNIVYKYYKHCSVVHWNSAVTASGDVMTIVFRVLMGVCWITSNIMESLGKMVSWTLQAVRIGGGKCFR